VFFGSEGHCGRTRTDYYTHCEKLYHSHLQQRGYPNESKEILEPQPLQPMQEIK